MMFKAVFQIISRMSPFLSKEKAAFPFSAQALMRHVGPCCSLQLPLLGEKVGGACQGGGSIHSALSLIISTHPPPPAPHTFFFLFHFFLETCTVPAPRPVTRAQLAGVPSIFCHIFPTVGASCDEFRSSFTLPLWLTC